MSDENLDENKLYLVGEGDKQVAMPESEMVRRIEQWYDNLSEKDQKKFRERLWAPIRELGEQQQMANDPTEPTTAEKQKDLETRTREITKDQIDRAREQKPNE